MMGAGRFFTIFTNHEPIDMPEELLNLGLSQRNLQTGDQMSCSFVFGGAIEIGVQDGVQKQHQSNQPEGRKVRGALVEDGIQHQG